MTIVGIILLIVAVVCFFMARGQEQNLRIMAATDTYSSQMLNELHAKVTSSLGKEALAQQCEIEGQIECDKPLTGPLSGTACVAYLRTVVREYEEDVTETDDHGKRTTRTVRNSETLESEDRKIRFWVRDATGRVLVDPEGAELDLADTADRYDPAPQVGHTRARTLGHRSHERALAIGTQVYVLGCAVDCQDQPMISRNPRSGDYKFLISRRGERELAKEATSTARNLYYAAAGLGGLGVVLAVLGML